eukprot:TRINITY_DN27683_c1_g1_i1.p1 TRINITY_DN27683_c1_g1~~TRINITY_DN27683_c1_g1_i1.p1  ORF type:complete len:954 (+),score=322.82 TRINITY_DN27683_c1_g1_i1:155-3016(+)
MSKQASKNASRRVQWFDEVGMERGFSERYKASEVKVRKEKKLVMSQEKFTQKSTAELRRLQRRITRQIQKDEIENEKSNTALLPTARASASAIRNAVINDIHKTHDYQQATCYFIFLAIVTMTTFIHLLRDQTNSYYTVDSVSGVMLSEEFTQASTWDDWWTWLEKSATRVEQLVPTNTLQTQIQGPGLPLGFIFIRQWRVRRETCKIPHGLSRSAVLSVANQTCYPAWSQGTASTEAYGPQRNPFRPDSHEEYPLLGTSLQGKVATYLPEPVYSVIIPLREEAAVVVQNNSVANDEFNDYVHSSAVNSTGAVERTDVTEVLRGLRSDGFVDSGTSAISVEITGFMTSREQFFEAVHLAEAKPAGKLLPTHAAKLFRAYSWEGDRNRFAFAVDLLSFFYVVFFVFLFIRSIYIDLRLWDSVAALVTFWRLYDIAFIAMWMGLYYYKGVLWSEAGASGASSDYNAGHAKNYGGTPQAEDKFMRGYLQSLVESYDSAMIWQAWGMLLAWLRVLRYLSHTDRFGVVTRGVSRMAPAFLSILAMFFLVIVGLSIAGVMIFSSDFEAFSTLPDAISLAIRFILTQEITCKRGGACVSYFDMEFTDRVMTVIYIHLLMVLGFLVFLNVLVALVIGHLALAQESSKGDIHNWSPETLWRELAAASRRMRPAWLSRMFEPLTLAINNQEKPDRDTGGAVRWADLEQGDRLLVRKRKTSAWEPATVFQVVPMPGQSRPFVTVKRQSQKTVATESADDFVDVHREVPFKQDTVVFSAHARSMEDRYVQLSTMLHTMDEGVTLRKEEWQQAAKVHIPSKRALKIFDQAHIESTTASSAQSGDDLAEALGRRINLLAACIGEREPNLQLVPQLADEDLMSATQVLLPLSQRMVGTFADMSQEMRDLRDSISRDFAALASHHAEQVGQLAEKQAELGPFLGIVNKAIRSSKPDTVNQKNTHKYHAL